MSDTTKTKMNRRSMPQGAIDFMKEAGFRVYMRNRANNYAMFAEADGIGYVQFDPMAGYTVATVHYPNKESGTGYQVARHVSELTVNLLEQATRTVVPHEHRRDNPPRKYASMADYMARDKWNAEYQEV